VFSSLKRRCGALGLLPIILFVCAVVELRADVTGSFFGTVRDKTGAVIPGVRVVATNLDTNLAQESKSDASGQYRIQALSIGKYRIEATAIGFQTFVVSGLTLDVNQQRQVDIAFEVGATQDHVEVAASALAVETASSQLGQVVDQRRIMELPLNGRSYIDLLALQPGVAPVSTGSGSSRTVSGELSAGNLSVNGNREMANSFLVNGGDVSEGMGLGTQVIPNLDSVAEFRLITNGFDAEYGKFSGGVMNSITKSGTNGFHGSAFEFVRNKEMDARSFFDRAPADLKRNQFGYAVGGPAIKNKVFWFTDYQGTREIQGVGGRLVNNVPTDAQRSGTFSPSDFVDLNGNPATVNGSYWAGVLTQRLGYGVTAGEPYSGANCTSTSLCVFPNGVIPQRAFDTVAVKTLKYIPTVNYGTNQVSTAGLANLTVRDDKAGQRVDINNNKTGNWSVYYFFDDATTSNPFGAVNLPGFGTITPIRAQEAVVNNTKILGPTAVNEIRVAFSRSGALSGQPTTGFAKLSDLGFVTGANTLGLNASGPASLEGVPKMDFLGYSFGSSTFTGDQYNNTYQAAESFSKVWSRHSVKIGGEYRYYQVNLRNINVPNGNFGFSGYETGSDFADYLLGAASSFVQSSQQALDARAKYFGAFVQDSFRASSSLTLNFGLRWDVNTPWYDTQNRLQTIIPGEQSVVFPTAPRGWVFPGDPGVARTLSPVRYNNFAPRVGLAYSPGASDGILGKIFGGPGKTSIRAGFGIYYSSVEALPVGYEIGDAPFGQYWNSTGPVLLEEPYRTRADGSSQGQRFPYVTPAVGGSANKNVDFSVFEPLSGSPGWDVGNKTPYAEHYNFTIQRSIGKTSVVSLGYVGTQGHHLIGEAEANPGNAALCLSLRGNGVKAGTPECGRYGESTVYTRPDGTTVNGTRDILGPAFGSNQYSRSFANSNYNSLQASVQRSAANMTVVASYTFSKSIDDTSSYGGWVNFSNYRLSRSLSSFDLTHNFVVSYAYQIPFDRAFRVLPKRMTQGWSINGITRFATGLPITISQGGDWSLTGTYGVDMPNYIGGLVFSDPHGRATDGRLHEYFNKSAFSSETLGVVGNSSGRFFHGPGTNNWDLSVHKDTRLYETMTLQFRTEFFNALNHAKFYNPSGYFNSSSMGVVSGAGPGRIGQLSMKFLW
jgi:hypothetical protein